MKTYLVTECRLSYNYINLSGKNMAILKLVILDALTCTAGNLTA